MKKIDLVEYSRSTLIQPPIFQLSQLISCIYFSKWEVDWRVDLVDFSWSTLIIPFSSLLWSFIDDPNPFNCSSWFHAFTFPDEKSIEELVPKYFTRLLFGLLLLLKRQSTEDEPFGKMPELLHRIVSRGSWGFSGVNPWKCFWISTIILSQKIKNPWRTQWNSHLWTLGE